MSAPRDLEEPAAARRVVVVGGGLAGLACARTLAERAWTVTVVDKGRRPGGRACSRDAGEVTFDHGAQFFTARGDWLQRHVASWEADGVVARWEPRVVPLGATRARDGAPWWVGTPSMGALAAHMARDLRVECASRVIGVERTEGGAWSLARTTRDGAPSPPLIADAVVVALPSAQAGALLEVAHPALARAARAVTQTPCWAVMLTARGLGDLGADVFEDARGVVAWAAREASKPGRRDAHGGDERWLLHASTAWSEAHLEEDPDAVARSLTDAFFEVHGRRGDAEVVRAQAHRWRYARGHLAEARGALFDAGARLVVCGDWVNGSRVEGALTSGVAAAQALLGLDPTGALHT